MSHNIIPDSNICTLETKPKQTIIIPNLARNNNSNKVKVKKNPVGIWEKHMFLLLHFLDNDEDTDEISRSIIPKELVYNETEELDGVEVSKLYKVGRSALNNI